MSYILDALKKIEHEKNKKKLPDGRVSITGDLFQEQKRLPVRSGIWKMALLIAVAMLLTFAGTWYVFRQSVEKKRDAALPQIAQQVPVSATPPLTTESSPLQEEVVEPRPLSVAEPALTPTQAVVVPEATRKDETDAKGLTDIDRPPSKAKAQSKIPPQPQPHYPEQAAPIIAAPADIILSGIAWQDAHALRRAVINGFLLKEGAVVSGATISDIRPDRVRFSTPSGIFEIKLDAVLPAEVHR